MNVYTQDMVASKVLFELDRAKELLLSESLLKYLIEKEFPWFALGAPLFKFVEECVNKVPENERIKGTVSKHAHLEHVDKIVISEGAVIEPHVCIEGPAFIEPHAVVRHGAYIRGPAYISTYAIVGHATECKGSVFLPHAKAAHMNYVGDSILGYDCNLGAGTKLANLKISHTNIILRFGERRVDSQLRKFGAIVGNRVSTGCNSVTNPGTILLRDSRLLPNCTALGIVEPVQKHVRN